MSTKKNVNGLTFIQKKDGALTLGRVLANIRLCDLEMTPSQFARHLGMPRQHIYELERDKRALSVAKAAAIAKILKHPPQYFVMLVLRDQVRKAGIHGHFDFAA